jgi:hypothetical protein
LQETICPILKEELKLLVPSVWSCHPHDVVLNLVLCYHVCKSYHQDYVEPSETYYCHEFAFFQSSGVTPDSRAVQNLLDQLQIANHACWGAGL